MATISQIGVSTAVFGRPTFISPMPNGKLCVSDAGSHKLVVLSSSAKRVRQPKHMPVLNMPSGVACDESAVYVADQGTHQIHRLDIVDFSPIGIAGGPGSDLGKMTSPQGLVLINNVLYVSDSHNHRIAMYHPQLLEPVGQPFGREGCGEVEFCYPHGLAVLSNEAAPLLVIADTHNHRVQIVSLDGAFVRAFGQHGTNSGEFDEPSGYALRRACLHSRY